MSGITKSIGRAFKRLDGKTVASAALLAVGGYYLAGGFDSAASGVAATDAAESGGTLALDAAGTGVTPTDAASAPLDFTGNSTPLPEPGPMDLGSTTGVDPGVEANTGLTVPPDPTATSAPAPTSTPTPDTSQPAPSPTASQGSSAPVAQTSTSTSLPPVVDKSASASNTRSGHTMDWFKNLSPAAQMAIAGTAAGGAGAIMNALAQKHAQEFQYEQEQRKRDDVIRRGQVPAFAAGGLTPGRGIIDMTRGG